MDKLKNVKNKVIRVAIDGVYFSGNVELTNDEKDFQELLDKRVQNIILILSSIFRFEEHHQHPHKTGFTLEDPRGSGHYIKISIQASSININIQFKGYFFVSKNAWTNMKCYMLEVISSLQVFFRPTLIDIAQDINLKTHEVLPYPDKQNIDNGLSYNFKYNISNYTEKGDNDEIFHTGFVISNSRFKIKLYDKLRENEKSRNQIKKNFYKKYYSDYNEVSRLELTIKQESCKPFWESIYLDDSREEIFALQVFRYFGQKHSARLKPVNSKDSDKSRWPKLPNWEYLFDRLEDKGFINRKTPADLLYTGINITWEKVLTDFSVLILNERSTTLSELQKSLAVIYKDAEKLVESKKSKRRFSKSYLKKLLDEILPNGTYTPRVPRCGGDSITSPPNRNLNKNSASYRDQGGQYAQ